METQQSKCRLKQVWFSDGISAYRQPRPACPRQSASENHLYSEPHPRPCFRHLHPVRIGQSSVFRLQ